MPLCVRFGVIPVRRGLAKKKAKFVAEQAEKAASDTARAEPPDDHTRGNFGHYWNYDRAPQERLGRQHDATTPADGDIYCTICGATDHTRAHCTRRRETHQEHTAWKNCQWYGYH